MTTRLQCTQVHKLVSQLTNSVSPANVVAATAMAANVVSVAKVMCKISVTIPKLQFLSTINPHSNRYSSQSWHLNLQQRDL